VEQPTYGHGADPGYGQGYGYGNDPTYRHPGQHQGQQPGYEGYEAGYGHPGGPPEPTAPVWAPAPPPVPTRRRGLSTGLIVFLTVLAVLAVGGVGFAAWKLGDDGDDANANPGATTSAGPTPTTEEEPTAPPTQATGSPTDARFAKKGQCLVNKGTNKRPEIQLVDCGRNTFEVVARYDGTADFKTRCGKVKGYTDHYFYDSEVDSLDFVLCLKRRR
jgi:hypothetical protein